MVRPQCCRKQGVFTPAQQRTIVKLVKRLGPFLNLCYFVAYLDRVNVGFAARLLPNGSGNYRPRKEHQEVGHVGRLGDDSTTLRARS